MSPTPPRARVRPRAPHSVSNEARRFLDGASPFRAGIHPADDDTDGWLDWVADTEGPVREMFARLRPPPEALSVELADYGGVPTYVLTPAQLEPGPAAVIEFHGGGLVSCGGDLAWQMTATRAAARSCVTLVPDYRLAPRHRYPAGLDDAVNVYRAVLDERPSSEVIVFGGSAGGNLAAALLLRAVEGGLPMPAALVLVTPELDLSESGDSFVTNHGIDVALPLLPVNRMYAAGIDLSHPHVSPLFGDVSRFPPTFLQAGTRDIFLSNTVRMHRKLIAAGIPCEMHIFEAMPHGGFGGESPEDIDLAAAISAFEIRHLSMHSELFDNDKRVKI